jgi:hypothetical protein
LITLTAAAVVLGSFPAAPADSGEDSFLIPGVALSDAEFRVGAWCRYLVIDEIMGGRDSTTVYIAVTGVTRTATGEAYWVELESGAAGAAARDRESASALISSDINDFSPGDSLCQYIIELYIKRGTGAVEPADPAELERLTLSNPTSDSEWALSADETVETPQGRFECSRKHLAVEDKREIPMGRVTLVKNDADVYDVWFCDDVPIFRVVKCVIDRVRESRTLPAVPGIPDKGREESRTTVELLAYGSDAQSKIKIP